MKPRPLRIAIVAHGRRKIPASGWGAVENIIYQYAIRMQARGHQAIIINAKWRLASYIVAKMRIQKRIDICHVHNDKALLWLAPICKHYRMPLFSTSHYFFDPENLSEEATEALGWLAKAPLHLVLHSGITPLILERNPGARIAVLSNGTEVKSFEERESGNRKAICIGKLQARKRQRDTARVLSEAGINCEFVGPIGDQDLEPEHSHLYLGEWTRAELYKKLCEYSVLVLFSQAEGQALVVVEALAAGLSVVVSPNATQNLDLSLPFVYVANDENELAKLTAEAISKSDHYRKQARAYAEKEFDFDNLVVRYEELLYQLIS